MKKFRYLFTSILMLVLSITMVEAKEAPEFTTSLNVTKVDGSDKVHVEATIKNAATSCNGVGIKDGAIDVYLDENIVASVTNLDAVARLYNEEDGNFFTKNIECRYDETTHQIHCFGLGSFVAIGAGDVQTSAMYSGCKDEFVINFETELCASSENCNIKVEVKGTAVDYTDYTMTPLSSENMVLLSKNFNLNSAVVNNPTTPTEPDNNYEPDENPNTVDNGMLYMLLGTLSLVLMITTVVVNKNKKNA